MKKRSKKEIENFVLNIAKNVRDNEDKKLFNEAIKLLSYSNKLIIPESEIAKQIGEENAVSLICGALQNLDSNSIDRAIFITNPRRKTHSKIISNLLRNGNLNLKFLEDKIINENLETINC